LKFCLEPSSGPEIGLLKRYNHQWSSIDQKCYDTAMSDQIWFDKLKANNTLRLEAHEYAEELLVNSLRIAITTAWTHCHFPW
jgi:hypothetical protein